MKYYLASVINSLLGTFASRQSPRVSIDKLLVSHQLCPLSHALVSPRPLLSQCKRTLTLPLLVPCLKAERCIYWKGHIHYVPQPWNFQWRVAVEIVMFINVLATFCLQCVHLLLMSTCCFSWMELGTRPWNRKWSHKRGKKKILLAAQTVEWLWFWPDLRKCLFARFKSRVKTRAIPETTDVIWVIIPLQIALQVANCKSNHGIWIWLHSRQQCL